MIEEQAIKINCLKYYNDFFEGKSVNLDNLKMKLKAGIL